MISHSFLLLPNLETAPYKLYLYPRDIEKQLKGQAGRLQKGALAYIIKKKLDKLKKILFNY